MEFEGGTLVSMTMSAFTAGGRKLRLMGTNGDLIADMSKPADEAFALYRFDTRKREFLKIDHSNIGDSILAGHGGGDTGIVQDLYRYVIGEIGSEDLSEIGISTKNHMIAFAAEQSRLDRTVVNLDEYVKKLPHKS
jgi:hypothetical protein